MASNENKLHPTWYIPAEVYLDGISLHPSEIYLLLGTLQCDLDLQMVVTIEVDYLPRHCCPVKMAAMSPR